MVVLLLLMVTDCDGCANHFIFIVILVVKVAPSSIFKLSKAGPFGGLGEHLNCSLATEKPSFWQLKNRIRGYLSHRKCTKVKMVGVPITLSHR